MVYLPYIYHKKSTIPLGKYTSPMDPMGKAMNRFGTPRPLTDPTLRGGLFAGKSGHVDWWFDAGRNDGCIRAHHCDSWKNQYLEVKIDGTDTKR